LVEVEVGVGVEVEIEVPRARSERRSATTARQHTAHSHLHGLVHGEDGVHDLEPDQLRRRVLDLHGTAFNVSGSPDGGAAFNDGSDAFNDGSHLDGNGGLQRLSFRPLRRAPQRLDHHLPLQRAVGMGPLQRAVGMGLLQRAHHSASSTAARVKAIPPPRLSQTALSNSSIQLLSTTDLSTGTPTNGSLQRPSPARRQPGPRPPAAHT
jgi:hypothetical protein